MSPSRQFPADHFLNRELSLLAFNRRVLAQAADENVPLLERLRFLCIVSSNLDEFFEIRVAGLKEQIKLGSHAGGSDGMTPLEVFRRVTVLAHDLIADQYALLNDVILPALAREDIAFLRRSLWTETSASGSMTFSSMR
jgi:polyphosphate kinase